VATYREAIAREPNFPEAYNNLGNALREAGRPDEAIACYTACIQLQLQRPGAGASGVRPVSGPPWVSQCTVSWHFTSADRAAQVLILLPRPC
jgi:tetratricopeptide (TPR) repeat protein